VSLPINFLGREFAEAELRIVEPTEDKATIPLHFNPSEYKIKKENTFAEVPIPGLESPPLQYVRGGARVLSTDVLVDTSDDPKKSVHKEYVAGIERLMQHNDKLHAPPIVEFAWAEQKFRGVLQSLEITYLLFHSDGKPLRAKLSLVIKEYRPVDVRLKQHTSPDVEKRYVVRVGETLSSISGAIFRDPSHWREIAVANGITDPRSVAPGTVLTIPRLEAPRA
jgi:nucleoid-associated protein YgaU